MTQTSDLPIVERTFAEDIDHYFCEDCYPNWDPPQMLCGSGGGEPDDICAGDCGHQICVVCVEMLKSHVCINPQ